MLEFLEKPGVLIVLVLALLVFGQKRLPDAARSLGRSMRILKAETKGLRDDDNAQGATAVQVTQLPPVAPQPDLQADQVPAVPPSPQQPPPSS